MQQKRVITVNTAYLCSMKQGTDEYTVIKHESRAEIKVQGSRFLAQCSPSSTKEDAEQFIAVQKKHYFDATHNSYAYRIGADGFRFSDDGEPNGTAGKPILAAIDKFGLTNVVVVVTRYFGGTKLGVGGLSRAYREATEAVLSTVEKVTEFKTAVIDASFPHSYVGNVMYVVSKTGARILDTAYDEEVHMKLEIRVSKADELRLLLVQHTNGNIALLT